MKQGGVSGFIGKRREKKHENEEEGIPHVRSAWENNFGRARNGLCWVEKMGR